MRVVHISTHDVAGGAARAAFRVHRGVLELGVDSSMLVAVKGGEAADVRQVGLDRRLPARLRRWRVRRRIAADANRYRTTVPPGFERFSDDRAALGGELVRELPSAGLLHLHWVVDFLDYGQFFRSLPPKVRIVWTLHDMNPLTGGCHYDDGCGRFTGSCGACPQLGSRDEHDASRSIWTRKARALSTLSDDRMHIVTGSRWLREEVGRSSLLGRFPVTAFPYGIDTELFSPRDREAARIELGIEPDAKVLLFVADSVQNRRKGFTHLLGALDLIPDTAHLHLVSIGKGRPSIPTSMRHLHLDRIVDDDSLARVYSAADLFVMPSLQEAYGMTTLEALACGTPAVGFDSGGVREVIREGETGRIVPTGDTAALAAAIAGLLADPSALSRMRERCREIALSEHSLRGEAERYKSVYGSLA